MSRHTLMSRLLKPNSGYVPGWDDTFNLVPGQPLLTSFPLPYPGLSLRCLKAINKIQIYIQIENKPYRVIIIHVFTRTWNRLIRFIFV